MPQPPLNRAEQGLVLGVAALLALALLVPAFGQDPLYHRFADARRLWGVPNAMDVLSNAGFLVLGLWGLVQSLGDRLVFFSPALRAGALVAFAGFVLTGAGSALYHLRPDDAGLAWDRLGMTVVFAGVLGLVATQRVSERAGWALLALALLGGPASVVWWRWSGSVTPYAVLQFGGMLAAALCLFGRPRGPGPHWGWLLLAYTLAKGAEALDAELYAWSGGLLSGHTLKHLLAALPALAIGWPLRKRSSVGLEPAAEHPIS